MTEVSGRRLLSVDVFRGLTIAAMVIVNNPGDWGQVYAPLLHAEWNGWTPTDLIFPFFVFILGVSVTLSRRPPTIPVIIRRAAMLYALGFLLALYPRFDFSIVRVMGVLPRLAICALAAGLTWRAVQRFDDEVRQQIVLFGAAVLLLTYWALMMFVPPPGGVAGDLSPEGNLGAWVDRTVIGTAHLWRTSKTWDPEGLLSTVPAIASALTGIAAGITLRSSRASVERMGTLLVAGGGAVVLGVIWDQRFPINKNLWTSSYVLFTSGLASIALAACYWFFDARPEEKISERWVHPLVVMGRNPLALFVLSGWLVKTLLWIKVGAGQSLYAWTYTRLFLPLGLGGPKNTSLAFALAMLVVLYVPMLWLHKRQWYLRA